MKKFLLSLAVVLGIGFMATAETTTLPSGAWSDYTWSKSAAGDWSATISGCEFNLEKAEATSDYTNGPASDLRIYQGSVLTITAPTGITFSNIEISIASGSKATTATVSEGWTASAIADNKVTFSATAGQSAITFKGDKQLRIASMVVTSSAALPSDQKPVGEAKGSGTEADPYNATAALAIAKSLDESGSVEAYTYGTVKTVSIDTSYGNATYTITDGASNLSVFRGKYLNGDKFTSTDQLKEGDEVVVFGNLVNYKGNTPQYTTNSQIVKITGKDAGEVVITNVANIAEYLTKSVGDKVKFTSPVNAIYQNGNYLYVQDNTGNALVYGKLTNKYENGMAIAAGFEGSVAEFNSLKQLNPVDSTFAAGVAGTAIAPEAYAIEEISADIAHSYVSFEGVSIAAVEGNERNFTMTDETGSIVLYQQWTDIEIPVGENLNVVGFVGAYKGNAQILAVSITSASGKEIVAVPTFTPDGGAVLAGTEVTIACETEGATIYYTTDGTEPTTASTVYTEAIVVNEALTLKAIAAKEGMENSTVATAEFTIKEPAVVSGNTATFNFTDPSTLDPAYSLADSEPDGSNGNNKIDLENGVLFTANGITISTVASGNPTRLYCQKPDTDKTWSFRFFRNSVVTISCQQGYKLTSIEFEPQTTNYANVLAQNIKFSVGTLADNVLTFDADTTVTSVDLTNPSKNDGGNTCGLNTITVTFSELSGISDVEINENAPVEFFNLQGVRVNGDLTPGLYIRRQGNNATKVIVK